MTRDIYVLLGMTACGAAMSVLFDLRRGFHKSVKLPEFAVCAADFIFWIMCAAAVAWCIWVLNGGAVRAYEFVGLILGTVIYFVTLSGYVVAISAFFSAGILKIIRFIFKILLTPLTFLYKIISNIHIRQNNKEGLTDNE